MSRSIVKSGFIISRGTSFKAPRLHRILIYIKAWVSPSSEMLLLRKASYTLNLINLS
jgi:hypothetical protein